METDRTNDVYVEIIRNVVRVALKSEPTWKEIDGVFSYEVAPIPGDRLSEKEIHRIESADIPEDVLRAIIGGKYFDVISASEQGLFQYCAEKVRESMPFAEQAEILDVLSGLIRVDPPVRYYMEQLGLS